MSQYEGHLDQKFGSTTYSQHGEDLMLLNMLKLLNFGGYASTWLDLGAHHPVNISNTKLLYDWGYRGVNVEANPNLIAAFTAERPEDITVNAAISLHEGEGTFYMYDAWSGRNTFSAEEVCNRAADMPQPTPVRLPVTTVDAIVTKYCDGYYPFILSMDLEGLDFAVLSSLQFTTSYPAVIVVETRRAHTWRMNEMLTSKGYHMHSRMGENLIFVHNTYYPGVF